MAQLTSSPLLIPANSPKPPKSKSGWDTRPGLTQAQLNRHMAGSLRILWRFCRWIFPPDLRMVKKKKKSNFVLKPWTIVIPVMGINPLQRADDLEKIFSINLNRRSMISTFPNLRTKLVRNIRLYHTISIMQEYALHTHHKFCASVPQIWINCSNCSGTWLA